MEEAYNLTLDELAEIIPILKQIQPSYYQGFCRIKKMNLSVSRMDHLHQMQECDGYEVVFANEGGGAIIAFRVKDGKAVDIKAGGWMH